MINSLRAANEQFRKLCIRWPLHATRIGWFGAGRIHYRNFVHGLWLPEPACVRLAVGLAPTAGRTEAQGVPFLADIQSPATVEVLLHLTCSCQPEPARDLLDAQPLPVVESPNLCPVFHCRQVPPPGTTIRSLLQRPLESAGRQGVRIDIGADTVD